MEHLLTREYLWTYALADIIALRGSANIHFPLFERRISSSPSEFSARRALGSAGQELRSDLLSLYYTML